MRFVADESVDSAIVAHLRIEGHEVEFIAEMEPGIDDDSVLGLSRSTGAILIAQDTDFGEMVFRQHRTHVGVMLLRLEGLSSELKARLTSRAIAERRSELELAFSVISPGQIRIRRI